MNLTLDERTKIFDKVCRLVETKHFNPGMNGVDWNCAGSEPTGSDPWVHRTRGIREGSPQVGGRA